MKIRNKVTLLIFSLVVIIMGLGFFAIRTTIKMKKDTENILFDNYNSLVYAQKMTTALNNYLRDSIGARNVFMKNLELQQKNITEKNEHEPTEYLEESFKTFVKSPSLENRAIVSSNINSIILQNADAINEKSILARQEANDSMTWIIVLVVLCTAIAVAMLIYFPKAFTRPITRLASEIMDVANGHYDKRLDFEKGTEFEPVATSFNKMTQELAQFQRSSMSKIIATKEYLEVAINTIDQPIIGLNKDKNILFLNKSASTILNLKLEEVIGKSALDVSLNNDLLRRLIRGMEQENKEPLKIYSDNKESYFEVKYLPITAMNGTVIFLSNITKFKELDNAKTTFISIISHELKTPISAILMSLKLLEDQRVGSMNSEQEELAKSIQDNSNRLLSISGELLKMTQVESGALQLNPKITKPIELINYAIKATKMLAERFRCNIEVEYPEKISKLFVDSEKIAWVITNLLSNAIHYSTENARIIIGARQLDKKVEIYVRDFGKGIDPKYHQTIFDRYFRVPGTKVQGSGLGLAISKDFVEAHGGTIRVESELGKGSCFIISFDV